MQLLAVAYRDQTQERDPGPPAEGPGGDARTVRATAAAAVEPGAVRRARGGMALARGKEGGGGIKCNQK